MEDEMWAEYGRQQRKTVQGRQAWWTLGSLACQTIEEIARRRMEAEVYRQAWTERALGA